MTGPSPSARRTGRSAGRSTSVPVPPGVPGPLDHLRPGLVASVGTLAMAVALGGAAGGVPGMAGGLLGVSVVVVSFVLSSLAVAWADGVDRRLVLPVGLLTYVLKLAVLGGLLVSVRDAGWLELRATALAVVVATLVWLAAQLRWVWRVKIPYVVPQVPPVVPRAADPGRRPGQPAGRVQPS